MKKTMVRDIARRYKGVINAKAMLAEVIQSGTEGHWKRAGCLRLLRGHQ